MYVYVCNSVCYSVYSILYTLHVRIYLPTIHTTYTYLFTYYTHYMYVFVYLLYTLHLRIYLPVSEKSFFALLKIPYERAINVFSLATFRQLIAAI